MSRNLLSSFIHILGLLLVESEDVLAQLYVCLFLEGAR